MLHPITVELLDKSEYNRSKRRQACQLHNGFRASGSTSPSRIQQGMDLLRMLLLHAEKRLREARIALQALVREMASS